MRKQILKIVCVAMSLLCLNISTLAADNPDYLYDGITNYNMSQLRAGQIPSNVLAIPNDGSGRFTYTFAYQNKQYSDFIIAPQTNLTGIRMKYIATSQTHDLTIKVINKVTGEVVYNSVQTVLANYERELFLSFAYFEVGNGYYIELSNPSISGASGQFTISA